MKFYLTIALLAFCLVSIGQAMPCERPVHHLQSVVSADLGSGHHLSMFESAEDVVELDQDFPPLEAVDILVGLLPVQPIAAASCEISYRVHAQQIPVYLRVRSLLI